MSQFSTNYIRWEFSIFSKSLINENIHASLEPCASCVDDVDEQKYIVHDRSVKWTSLIRKSFRKSINEVFMVRMKKRVKQSMFGTAAASTQKEEKEAYKMPFDCVFIPALICNVSEVTECRHRWVQYINKTVRTECIRVNTQIESKSKLSMVSLSLGSFLTPMLLHSFVCSAHAFRFKLVSSHAKRRDLHIHRNRAPNGLWITQ